MAKRGTFCSCIRCREVGNDQEAALHAKLIKRSYASSGSIDHFISFESESRSPKQADRLLGFCRLRLPMMGPSNGGVEAFSELNGAALIRELHVYGQLVATNDRRKENAQHLGFGRRCEECV